MSLGSSVGTVVERAGNGYRIIANTKAYQVFSATSAPRLAWQFWDAGIRPYVVPEVADWYDDALSAAQVTDAFDHSPEWFESFTERSAYDSIYKVFKVYDDELFKLKKLDEAITRELADADITDEARWNLMQMRVLVDQRTQSVSDMWTFYKDVYELFKEYDITRSPSSKDELMKIMYDLAFEWIRESELTPSAPTVPNQPVTQPSPIILDLDGDGVETVKMEDGVHFDHDRNRFAEKTGWVHGDDALLIRDLNGNGQIDDGGELFGSNTLLANGKKAANGFVALAEMDSNKDGVVGKNDAGWGELRLWQDKDGDGVLDAGEMLTMEEAGVAGLNVDYKNQTVTDENGNQHSQTGTFVRENGSTGAMTDVWFKADPSDTRFMDEIEVNADISKLPDLRGYGNMPSLHQAMAADESGRLQALMEQFLNSDPITAKELTWEIIYAWTGVTDLAPKSRGQYIDDARKLYALEKIWGQDWLSVSCWETYDSNPHSKDAPKIMAAFDEWEAKISSYFLLSTHYNGLYKLAAQASTAIESGVAGIEAMKDLVSAMREMYGGGSETNHALLLDFLRTLNVYDPKGIACSSLLKSVYGNVVTTEEFEKWLIASFYKNIIVGSNNSDTLVASNTGSFIEGLAGNDTLTGDVGDDILDGGAGNDLLKGESGNDVYVFGRGYGHDRIDPYDTTATARDIVRLVGLTREDVEFEINGNSTLSNFLIRIKETGETLTILNTFSHSQIHWLEALEFSDGTVLEIADILAEGIQATSGDDRLAFDRASTVLGGEGNDTINGSSYNDTIHGDAGNDTMNGGNGNDTLYGGAGNDTMNGGNGNDTLYGGAGNDYLEGGAGDDTYIFHHGDGQDTITDTSGSDTLRFTDVSPAELWFGKSGNHLSIGLIGSTDKVTINNWYSSAAYKLESIEAGEMAITENQLALMVQAMVSIGAPGAADGGWTREQEEALAPVLAAYWQER